MSNDMSNLYKILDEVLVRKITLYSEIMEVLNEEWESIAGYSREKLEKALAHKELLLAKVHEVNHQREKIIQKFANRMGQIQQEVTLKTIIDLKDNMLGKRMAEHREKIREQLKTINEMNSANKQLITRSAMAMKKSMSWLYEIDMAYTPYYSNGRLSEPSLASRVVDTDV